MLIISCSSLCKIKNMVTGNPRNTVTLGIDKRVSYLLKKKK